MNKYRIKAVDGSDAHMSDILHDLHEQCFGTTAPQVNNAVGHWWLVLFGQEPVAFAGMTKSTIGPNAGYFKRSGVLAPHRGNGLQLRLIRAREAQAKRNGWKRIVTDTTGNVPSSNTLIRAGYKLFEPDYRWCFEHSLYWTKTLL
jgi:GNAT superfamily N-acetyltransferase